MRGYRGLSRHGRTKLQIAALGVALIIGLVAWVLQGGDTASIDSYSTCANAGYRVSETNPPTCSDGQHTYLGPTAKPLVQESAEANVMFELLVDGDSGGTYQNKQEIITSPSEWVHYWSTVHASLPALPPLIPVDFNTANVIALSEGRQPTNGYDLKITSVTASAAGSVVNVTESVPTITCKVTQAPSNRYFIARTAKLAEPVSFRITTVKHQC